MVGVRLQTRFITTNRDIRLNYSNLIKIILNVYYKNKNE
jgi:hypothetical protein